jgi:hypothetical protein
MRSVLLGGSSRRRPARARSRGCDAGGTWTSSVALYALDNLTTRQCVSNRGGRPIGAPWRGPAPTCATKSDEVCTRLRGHCELVHDGYRTELLVCTALGCAWLLLFRPLVLRLQARPISDWRMRPDGAKSD